MENENKNGYDVVRSSKKAILSCNPLLIECVGFSPAVIAASDLKLALGISALTLVSVMVTGLIVSSMRKVISDKMKIIFIAVISAGVALLESSAAMAFFPSLFDRLGILFPFAAFNSFVILFANSFASKNKMTLTLVESFINGAGFAVALCVLATVREALAYGTVFGAAVFGADNTGISFFKHPAGIMLAAGVVAAIFKALGGIGGKKRKKNGGVSKND